MKLALLGATGVVGSALLKEALDRRHIADALRCLVWSAKCDVVHTSGSHAAICKLWLLADVNVVAQRLPRSRRRAEQRPRPNDAARTRRAGVADSNDILPENC